MFDNPEIVKAIDNYLEAWDEAEHSVKLAEQVAGELITSAIGELRYAGRRFADAIKIERGHANNIDGNGVIEAINEARNNCIRAEHDAVDAASAFLHDKIQLMQEVYGVALCLSSFDNYPELLKLQKEFAYKIQESRKDRKERVLIYKNIKDYQLPLLIKLHDQMVSSEQAVIEHVMKEKSKQFRTNLFTYMSAFVGILGIILSIFFYYS